MASALESALQRALATRLNLQISLSQLPIVEEWMDIHLDRWLEHNPMPPDMPDGEGVSFAVMVGSDLRRLWWGAWGDPRGFVPRMADYFKLCNIAGSDAQLLDQIGETLEPAVVGSWIGVWGGKVVTGWHFLDPQPWPSIEALFGTHEAKYQLKKWVEANGIARIERFAQSIGDAPYSELELAVPDRATLSSAFEELTGAGLPAALALDAPYALACRIRGGKIVRVGALGGGDVEAVCADTGLPLDPKLPRLVGALGRVARVEYGRAGERAGVDVHVEPGDPVIAPKQEPASPAN